MVVANVDDRAGFGRSQLKPRASVREPLLDQRQVAPQDAVRPFEHALRARVAERDAAPADR